MSKHWDPGRDGRAGQWHRQRRRAAGRTRRRPGPPRWPPRLGRREILGMLVTGLLLGLILWRAMLLWPAAMPAGTQPRAPLAQPNPYAEAERSRAILEAQEGAPPPALPRGGPLYSGSGSDGRLAVADGGGSGPTRASGPVHVIDGDTFIHAGMRVRIADIDTPEVHGRCASETALAARATARMRALLSAGPFELHAVGDGRDEDRYGRKLRIVTRGGRSLGDVLVAEGLARTWSGRREPWC
jgi:endonuclease YncB( thermonuclease family)